MAKKHEVFKKGIFVSKAVNPEGILPNPAWFISYPRIFTRDGHIIVYIHGDNINSIGEIELTDGEKLMYRHWVRDNYAPLEKIHGNWHPFIQRTCVNKNLKYLKDKLK